MKTQQRVPPLSAFCCTPRHATIYIHLNSSVNIMSKCPKCGKTVYFAERVTALGKDWHKLCLKCSTCNKILAPGSVLEHDNQPYCKSCYGSKIGPKGYGFGNSIDSHISGGAVNKSPDSPVETSSNWKPSGGQYTSNENAAVTK
jgi:phage FluMu protein Com